MVGHPRPAGPELFAVDTDSAQLTWSRLDPDVARVRIGDVVVDLDAGGEGALGARGPASLVVGGLPAGTLLDLGVETARGADRGHQPVRTLSPPPGRELFRFATISDLHLGERHFGYLGTIVERPQPAEPYSWRAAQAAVDELGAWGAELLIVKGDITVDARADDWEDFGRIVAGAGLPVMATPGNHDRVTKVAVPTWRRWISGVHTVRPGSPIPAADGLALAGFDSSALDTVQVRDVPGLRIVLVDTTVHGHRHGQVAPYVDEIADAARAADGPVLVALHHQLMTTPLPTYIPVGIDRDQSQAFLDRLVAANPAALVTSGHTHRHRRRRHGPVVVTEVGSPKDFPGTWAGYVVHEGGIRQVVRRIARPDVLRWTDRSASAALGLWGRWSPGTLDDRCFSHTWPTG
ncbi:MAG: metallophosphoesterase family protein [Acidimicrobiales bacterium]